VVNIVFVSGREWGPRLISAPFSLQRATPRTPKTSNAVLHSNNNKKREPDAAMDTPIEKEEKGANTTPFPSYKTLRTRTVIHRKLPDDAPDSIHLILFCSQPCGFATSI
jgi:hypothetical protein